MLVLARKIGERVIIGNGISITVLQTLSNQVRLGFDAPVGVAIRREELIITDEQPASRRKADLSRNPR